jgi:hypothetical protein
LYPRANAASGGAAPQFFNNIVDSPVKKGVPLLQKQVLARS